MARPEQGAISKRGHFIPRVILYGIHWDLRDSLSYRDAEELMVAQGQKVFRTTVWRWVHRYAPERDEQLRRKPIPKGKCWRVDETYVQLRGCRFYLYRAVDLTGTRVDFLLLPLRSTNVVKGLFIKARAGLSHPQSRAINIEKTNRSPAAISKCKEEGFVQPRCRHRPIQHLDNTREDVSKVGTHQKNGGNP